MDHDAFSFFCHESQLSTSFIDHAASHITLSLAEGLSDQTKAKRDNGGFVHGAFFPKVHPGWRE
jgi:hypothetical protein